MLPEYNTITASAAVLTASRLNEPKNNADQDILWDYYETLGEFEAAVLWKAKALSRIRLLAAEVVPGGDAPIPLEDGVAAETMQRFAGGMGGQSDLLREMTIHLTVPGEGWVVGEDGAYGQDRWTVMSADELTVKNNVFRKRVGDGRQAWEDLVNPLVIRFWVPDTRLHYRARPPAKSAIGALRELDLVNKRILAEITSRLASNGILLFDEQRLSITNKAGPTDPEQKSVLAEVLVNIATQGIKDPTSPGAVIPIPIGVDKGDSDLPLADLIHHVQLAGPISDGLIAQRESAIKRVATALDQPAEVMLGMDSANHWSAWQMEESALKIHISSTAETICYALTKGFLHPYLQADGSGIIGPNGGQIIAWYDPAELVQRPDHSRNATQAYDRLEISAKAYRRELGFAEEDAPERGELEEMGEKLAMRGAARSSGISQPLAPALPGQQAEPDDSGKDIPDEPDEEAPAQEGI